MNKSTHLSTQMLTGFSSTLTILDALKSAIKSYKVSLCAMEKGLLKI